MQEKRNQRVHSPQGPLDRGAFENYRRMTQEERWMKRYHEVIDFIETNHRNPSRHRVEEHDMLNWVKANRKVMNKGERPTL